MERTARLIRYGVPWRTVFSLTPHILHHTRTSVDEFTAAVVARVNPPPIYEGLDNLPPDPRFLLVANHYQRKGLWILHPASALTQAVARRYGPTEAPIRWIVTANWPPIRLGPLRVPSPGDWLLPRVAHALHCYPVSFAGSDPTRTALSYRRLIREARAIERPIGLFPEGVAGIADRLNDPLPGVERLIAQLARTGLPALPAAIGETGDRLILRFGPPVPPDEILAAPDAARLLMSRIAGLTCDIVAASANKVEGPGQSAK